MHMIVVMASLKDTLDSNFFKALSEPARIEVMLVMAGLGEADVSSISNQMEQDGSVISRHLKLMAEAGVVRCQKSGRHKLYRLNGPSIIEKLKALTSSLQAAVAAGCC